MYQIGLNALELTDNYLDGKNLQHNKHRDSIGYYKHYHINGHTNGAHVWYLFG